LAAGPSINNSGEIAGKVKGVALVKEWEGERKFESSLRFSQWFFVLDYLAVKGDLASRRHGIND
jgi:hypothetical protein